MNVYSKVFSNIHCFVCTDNTNHFVSDMIGWHIIEKYQNVFSGTAMSQTLKMSQRHRTPLFIYVEWFS